MVDSERLAKHHLPDVSDDAGVGYHRVTVQGAVCPRHPNRSTKFVCDGCGEALCEECVEEGHRLLFCPLCGERALPMASDGPATSAALASERKRFAAYGLSDALGYVFRGHGSYVFWSFPALVAALAIVGMLPLLGVLSGCIQIFFGFVVLVILPGALFAVVRESARGEVELPDWPEFSQFGARLGEIFEFVLVGLVAAIPGAILMRASGCSDLGAGPSPCWLVLALSWLAATLLWVPAFGSVAVYRDFLLTFRLDLHLRAVRHAARDFGRVVAFSMGLVLIGQTVALLLLAAVPVVGLAVSAVVGLYTWFTIAHLVGWWFRRNARQFSIIYRG